MSGERIRRQLGYSMSKGRLAQSATEETDADRIGALAMSDKLGAAILHVLFEHDRSSLREACVLLGERLVERGKMKADDRLLGPLCMQALEEWMCCQCPACGGHRFVNSPEGVRATCGECAGTGRGSYDHSVRMYALKLTAREYARLIPVFECAAKLLTAADNRVAGQVRKQLER